MQRSAERGVERAREEVDKENAAMKLLKRNTTIKKPVILAQQVSYVFAGPWPKRCARARAIGPGVPFV